MVTKLVQQAKNLTKQIIGLEDFHYEPSLKVNPNLLTTTHIIVACFPKSGSTYLTKLLAEITGFQLGSTSQFFGQNEQDIHEYKLRKFCRDNFIVQQHLKATNNNLLILQAYQLRPIILLRNIFDAILSLQDHIEKQSHLSPTGYIHQKYFEMTKEEQLLFLIHIHLPWYFNFFVSWREASPKIDTLWLSYEELFANQPDTLSKILKFYNIDKNPAKIESAISSMTSKKTRLNVGISGRGAQMPEMHKEAVYNLARVWQLSPQDMEIIGLKEVSN
ncbi:sulfotransferase domain-containing protein [Merismopedia glauca]|uniref:Sulfotransferase domain-containing protein n=1 Tax=Merismopedia glauca CCAP 1448/3 TaxID=1296344 RepID=A0A2T1C334_9CYAN|nr:sulfotransferase domain-containing protein [Merismopedia glauca]PSB02680.1 hypothetical protein C7B64_11935 [Merismopedia glauca CCAP 1448/3]